MDRVKGGNQNLSYRRDELFCAGSQKTFRGIYLNEISFPLGGIGTGSIGLSGHGALVDWEILNKPNKGYRPKYTFFSVWVKKDGEKSIFRVLEGRLNPPYQGELGGNGMFGHGPNHNFAPGLPRLESNTFTGRYPFAEINFQNKEVPLKISLEAFNPFIPLNEKDSSIPVAIFKVRLRNNMRKTVRATLAINLENLTGYPEYGKSHNQFRDDKILRGLFMTTEKHPVESPRFGSLALVTPWKDITYQTQWYRGNWRDSVFYFLNTFARRGFFDNDKSICPSDDKLTDIGSIGLKVLLKPGEEAVLPVLITWHFPWFEKYWDNSAGVCCPDKCESPKWKNYYATLFTDAWDVAYYTVKNLDRLEKETRLYHGAIFGSTLPAYVLDAVSSQTSTLKTTTCLRLTDGTLWGWEGCSASSGCCEGTCSHVWNYAQTVAYLFPKLERSMREAEYNYAFRGEDGHMQFRLPLPLGTHAEHNFHAAADGQLGEIMRVYREWKICGDDSWLKKLWPRVKKSLEYAWVEWDVDRDGIIEGVHHNTYDIEFHGPETMSGSIYLGALRAAEEMARYLGENKKADEYRKLFESGTRQTDKKLFNGEFYSQKIEVGKKSPFPSIGNYGMYLPDTKEKSIPQYQIGNGCLIDQLIGQWYARMLGLGYLYRPDNVRKALASIFRYNWRSDFLSHINPSRAFALNDDKGVLICSWPKGGRPEFPFPSCDEVMEGFEYQLASHLIYEGLILEGLSVVKAIRERHDGFKRNPWNEFECGSHYVRSMASWAVMLALEGFSYSAPESYLGFNPCINRNNFRCFFSVDSGWGFYQQKVEAKRIKFTVNVLYGQVKILCLEIGGLKIKSRMRRIKIGARLGKQPLDISVDVLPSKIRFTFKKTVMVTPEQNVKIEFHLEDTDG